MPKDLPDWTKAYLLQGQNAAGDPVTILLTNTGQMAAILQGETALGALKTLRVDGDGQMIMVPRGASGNYLEVDGSGFLTAVLKGEGVPGLTTIAVDAEGRLQVFLLDDESQWGNKIVVGNAEMAARLGSADVYDWRGQAFYIHDFHDGYGSFYCTEDGTGAAFEITSDYKMRGGFSLKLTGGSVAGDWVRALGTCGLNPSTRIGFLVAMSGYTDTTDVFLRAKPSGTRWIGGLRYDWAGQKLYYFNDAGGWTLVDTVYVQSWPYIFNNFKVVIDTETHKYIRALVNDQTFDLSAIDLESDAVGWPGTCTFEIFVTSREDENDIAYVDHIILTVNEP